MMFYTSKLISDATERQEQALEAALAFADPLVQAMALADHFEKIQAEEYIIPETAGFQRAPEARVVKIECHTAL